MFSYDKDDFINNMTKFSAPRPKFGQSSYECRRHCYVFICLILISLVEMKKRMRHKFYYETGTRRFMKLELVDSSILSVLSRRL